MGGFSGIRWLLLEYGSHELLRQAVWDRDQRVLVFPAVGRMAAGQSVDIQVAVEGSTVLFPLKARVIEVNERPESKQRPRGVWLQIIPEDRERFALMCAFADRAWEPAARRAVPRYPAEIRAAFVLDGAEHPAETADISERGVYLRTGEPLLEPGRAIFVRLWPSRLRTAIELHGQVRWVDPVEGRRGMGILCLGPNESLQRLRRLVESIRRRARG
jgi:hypothetical protein